ncbi:transposase [Streptomyces sp. NPDC048604]|uniref:transposase n=1 Tax=Streptomyces sp. NPDC048604 TaxID=3365578 RepID=UPI003719EFBD
MAGHAAYGAAPGGRVGPGLSLVFLTGHERIARACDLARAFTDLVRKRRGQLLTACIRQAEQSDVVPVAKFAAFLRQDIDAVTAGLTHEWSSGRVESHVNRVKTIKRAIYGRAPFRLLRIRILTRPK